MNEGNFSEKESRQAVDLDQRLSAYYGPPLPEQPLATSSWQAVYSQLAPRRPLKRQFVHLFQRRYPRRRTVPTFVQQAFTHIVDEARLPYTSAMLMCSLKLGTH